MKLFSFFKKKPLKQKILAIKEDIEVTVSKVCDEKNWVDWYGAYDIDPQYLVFWICVMSDDMKQKLKSDAELNAILKNIPSKHGYPTEVKSIDFESQETVDRESKGNWYQHFK